MKIAAGGDVSVNRRTSWWLGNDLRYQERRGSAPTRNDPAWWEPPLPLDMTPLGGSIAPTRETRFVWEHRSHMRDPVCMGAPLPHEEPCLYGSTAPKVMRKGWWEQGIGRKRYKGSKLSVGRISFLCDQLCYNLWLQLRCNSTVVRLLSIANTAVTLHLTSSLTHTTLCTPSSYPEDTSAHSTSDLPGRLGRSRYSYIDRIWH